MMSCCRWRRGCDTRHLITKGDFVLLQCVYCICVPRLMHFCCEAAGRLRMSAPACIYLNIVNAILIQQDEDQHSFILL
jgi:hypothetical protein